MIEEVPILRRVSKEEIYQFIDSRSKEKLERLSEGLKGKRVLHLNATPSGGGVAEILLSFIPYLKGLSVEGIWYTLDSDDIPESFFITTDKLRHALQGQDIAIGDEDWRIWEEVNEMITDELNKISYDILVLHDWQPLPAGVHAHSGSAKIYVSHPDTSSPQRNVWERIFPLMNAYDRIFFSNEDFIHEDLPEEKVRVFAPAIDPLSLKQEIVDPQEAKEFLKTFGLDPKKPLIVQVSRFDIWKNPLGLIEAFRIVQKTHPNCQLALVGIKEAEDNPEASYVFNDVAAVAKDDPSIFLFFEPEGISDITAFTMMAQNAADIVVQNSIREGFGLTVTEAMWKKKPVVGGPASGIRKQIIHGKNGFIAETTEELAETIIRLLRDPHLRKVIGEEAQKSVKEKFLLPRLLIDHMQQYSEVMG